VSGEVDSEEEELETTAAERKQALSEVVTAKSTGAVVTVQSFEIKQSMVRCQPARWASRPHNLAARTTSGGRSQEAVPDGGPSSTTALRVRHQ